MEAVPYTAERFARANDLRPVVALMDWWWDGAAAELMAGTWLWCVVHRPTPFVRAFSLQKPLTRVRVLDAMGADLSRSECRSNLARSRKVGKREQILFWQSLLPKTDP